MPWQVSKYISSLLTRLKRSNLLPGFLGPNPRQDDLVLEQYNRISLPLGLSVSEQVLRKIFPRDKFISSQERDLS